MTEHEKLKEICDKIEYDLIEVHSDNKIVEAYDLGGIKTKVEIELDVREIIFTPEFMDKYSIYCGKNKIGDYFTRICELNQNLDNPVDYLYNLLELGNTATSDTETLIQKN